MVGRGHARALVRARAFCCLALAAPAGVSPGFAGVDAAATAMVDPAPVVAPVDDPAAADSTIVVEIPVGLEEVVAELDLADQPVAWREIVAGNGMSGPSARPAASAGISWRTSGSAGGARHDGRLEARTGRFLARGALRLRPGESAAVAGAAAARAGALRIWAGHLALRHGFGLAGPDAGRRGTLAADQSLGGVAGGMVARTAADATSGGLQGGVELHGSGWNLAALAGLPGSPGAGPAWSARAEAVRDRGQTQGRVALAAGSDSSGSFGSLAGRLANAGLDVSGEVAGWKPDAGATAFALVGGVTWRPVAPLRLELQSGLATQAVGGAVAVLPSGASSGWAARVAWRDRVGGALQLLVQGSQGTVRQAEPRRRAAEVVDAVWERRAGGGFSFEMRCRRTNRRELTWSARQPWLPGIEGLPLARTSLQAAVHREARDWRLGLQWRSFAVGGSTADGDRQALSLSGRQAWRGRWEAWFDATVAWGDRVDLVRALVPLPGLVAARHWGTWRSEALVGGRWRSGRLAAAAAVARRLPDATAAGLEGPVRADWEGWLEVRGTW